MAEAVERRARALGLSPGLFAQLAGLTEPGLAPVRQGMRKQYAMKTRRGVAVALRWPLDWYERIVDGEDATRFPDTDHPDAPRTADQRITALEQGLRDVQEKLSALVDGVQQQAP